MPPQQPEASSGTDLTFFPWPDLPKARPRVDQIVEVPVAVPHGYRERTVEPEAGYYHKDMGEFVVPYEAVRTAADPDAALLAFLQSTYEAAASLADWDRTSA